MGGGGGAPELFLSPKVRDGNNSQGVFKAQKQTRVLFVLLNAHIKAAQKAVRAPF